MARALELQGKAFKFLRLATGCGSAGSTGEQASGRSQRRLGKAIHFPRALIGMRTQHQPIKLQPEPLSWVSAPPALWLGRGRLTSSAPGTIEKLHLCQSLSDHGGKYQAEEDAADQHVVVVILQDIKLFGRVDPSLVNVQAISHDQTSGLQARGSRVDTSHTGHCLVIVDESLCMDLDIWGIWN